MGSFQHMGAERGGYKIGAVCSICQRPFDTVYHSLHRRSVPPSQTKNFVCHFCAQRDMQVSLGVA
jgi:hypothetical protein